MASPGSGGTERLSFDTAPLIGPQTRIGLSLPDRVHCELLIFKAQMGRGQRGSSLLPPA